MCGIAGILELDPGAVVEPRSLSAMADALAHRGPDDEGFWIEPNVGLAHRRLSIIDLGGGHQPIQNEDGTIAIVFNGEIYNHAELRPGLEARGHRFATRSDTEVIVHAYEERGPDCVDDLRGMFAFAIWDRRRQRLLLARDRLGIKPLYYATGPGWLAFASEIKALLALPRVSRELDPAALDLYLSLRYVPGPQTMLRGIAKLEPGHVLLHDRHGLSVRRYWDVPRSAPSCSAVEAPERLLSILEESVRLRLMAEVPLGVFLSGGLDSTSVLAMLRRIDPGRRPHTFTVGYDGGSAAEADNEFPYARAAAEALGAHHHELRVTPADVRDALPLVAWHLDEPVADPAAVPLYLVSRFARRDITVVLSGEGADEVLGGYGIYRRMLALERLHRTPGGSVVPALASLLPHAALRRYAELARLPLPARYHGVSRAFLPEHGARLSGRSPGTLAGAVEDAFARHYRAAAGASPLEQMLYVDIKTWLPDDLLVKADKMTMAHGQELRVPFLDHRLVEMAAGLPASAKIRGRAGKAALRDAMAGIVPASILKRPKKGFPVPTTALLRSLRGFTRETCLGSRSACRDWFDTAEVERLVSEQERGDTRHHRELWTLLAFELWHDAFLRPAAAMAETAAAPAALAGGGPC